MFTLKMASGVFINVVSSSLPGRASVDAILKDLARLEGQHPAGTDCDSGAGLGIASAARVPVIYDEGAKAGDLDLATVAQAFANNREDRFDHFAGFLFWRTDALADQVHEIGFGHALRRISPPVRVAALTCALLRALSRCQSVQTAKKSRG
jgi:hypothetical protein